MKTKLKKLNVCIDVCHPPVGMSLGSYINSSGSKRKLKKRYFIEDVDSNNDNPCQSGGISADDKNATCALAHICAKVQLGKLATSLVSPQTAEKVQCEWKKAIINGQPQLAKHLAKIRALILVEVVKAKYLGVPIQTNMRAIISNAAFKPIPS